MRLHRHLYLCLVLGLLCLWSSEASARKLRIAFVYGGTANLPGWTFQHEKARKDVEKYFGEQIETKVVESLKPGADAERIIIGLARSGTQLIFITDPLLSPQAIEAAKRFPDVYFEIAQGQSELENVAVYNGRFYEAFYIFGQIAAGITKSGKLGFVARQAEPANMRSLNAYTLGAQSISKDNEIIVSYAAENTPVAEAAAARRVIDKGADVLSYEIRSPAPAQIAEQNGVWVFGNGSDMASFAPQWQVTSVQYDWGGYYTKRVQAALSGTWKAAQTWAGFQEGMVSLGNMSHLPTDIRDKAVDTRQRLIDGTLRIFQGPLMDKEGKERLKNKEEAGDQLLRDMDWYVEGNITIVPKL